MLGPQRFAFNLKARSITYSVEIFDFSQLKVNRVQTEFLYRHHGKLRHRYYTVNPA